LRALDEGHYFTLVGKQRYSCATCLAKRVRNRCFYPSVHLTGGRDDFSKAVSTIAYGMTTRSPLGVRSAHGSLAELDGRG